MMDEALERSLERLADKVGLVRKAAARELGARGERDVVPALLTAVGDKDGEVREEVARALGRLRDERALEALERLQEDQKPEVQRAAREASASIMRGRTRPTMRAPQMPGSEHPPSGRDKLVRAALEDTDAQIEKTPFGYEVELPLGGRKQRVRILFENRDTDGDPAILVQTQCGPAHEKNYRWALRQNFKFAYGHLAIRRVGADDQFFFCDTLLEKTTQPEELRKAVLAAAAQGDWVERHVNGGRDEF